MDSLRSIDFKNHGLANYPAKLNRQHRSVQIFPLFGSGFTIVSMSGQCPGVFRSAKIIFRLLVDAATHRMIFRPFEADKCGQHAFWRGEPCEFHPRSPLHAPCAPHPGAMRPTPRAPRFYSFGGGSGLRIIKRRPSRINAALKTITRVIGSPKIRNARIATNMGRKLYTRPDVLVGPIPAMLRL